MPPRAEPFAAATTPGAAPGVEPRPSRRSLRGLEAVNFLMADVQGGVGPYLAVYLAGSRGWSAGPVGIAMAAGSVSAAVFQVPAGLLVDAVRFKRLLVGGAGLLVGLGCLLIATCRGFWPVVTAQGLLGATEAVIPSSLAALSLGLVGRRMLPSRISRNAGFNHAGSFGAALLAGGCSHYLGPQWIFYLVCLFALASAACVPLIDPGEVDHDRARGAGGAEATSPVRSLLLRRDVAVFVASVVLFHFGNAAMLPLAGQMLARRHPGSGALALSACIICAQLVMVVVSAAVGRAMRAGIGRKPILGAALAILPVRGALFAATTNPYAVVAIQLLDGMAAGIFGVIAVVIAADLTRGTGRFNLLQGVVALAVGIGASLSNLAGGYVVQGYGDRAGFLFLGAAASCALVFFLLLMPETAGGRQTTGTGGQVPA